MSDAEGNGVAFPNVSGAALVKAVQLEVHVLNTDRSNWERLAVAATVGQMSLSSDRLVLLISGFTVPGHPMREAEGGRGVEAQLSVRMADASLPLELTAANVLFKLFAGDASKVRGRVRECIWVVPLLYEPLTF